MQLTATVGTNADIFPEILRMYVPIGSRVFDMTFGKGVFWRNVDLTSYTLTRNDLHTEADTHFDFKATGLESSTFDCVVFDPPYMHGGETVKKSINECYRNENTSHESVVRLYAGGILEAARLLRKRGVFIVKTQDEIESAKQRLTHVEVITLLEVCGFRITDLFVLVQSAIPALREKEQKSARKNHSYFIVSEFRR